MTREKDQCTKNLVRVAEGSSVVAAAVRLFTRIARKHNEKRRNATDARLFGQGVDLLRPFAQCFQPPVCLLLFSPYFSPGAGTAGLSQNCDLARSVSRFGSAPATLAVGSCFVLLFRVCAYRLRVCRLCKL